MGLSPIKYAFESHRDHLRDTDLKMSQIVASSNGRTEGFEPSDWGSNPYAATITLVAQLAEARDLES